MKKKIPKMTETEIAHIVGMYFEQKGWNMFPEVVLPNFYGRPDYVSVKQELCMVIECKTSLTYPVIEQLTRWHHQWGQAEKSKYGTTDGMGIPHLLIAVTERSNSLFPPLKKELMERYRIGYYTIERCEYRKEWYSSLYKEGVFECYGHDGGVCYYGDYKWTVKEQVIPKIQHGSRQTAHHITKHLNEDMKQGVAGSSGSLGEYMTPFKRTMNKVKTVLERGGEWHISKILEVINTELGGHHYCSDSSASGGISKFITELGIGEKVSDYPPKYKIKVPESVT